MGMADTTTSEDAFENYGPTPSICIDLIIDPYGLVTYGAYCATSLATHKGEYLILQLD